ASNVRPEGPTMRSGAFLLVAGLSIGCSGAAVQAPAGDGGVNGPGAPTPFPTGSTDGAPLRKPYPIVLAHGFSGVKNIGSLNYFYGITEALKNDGHDIWVAQVDPFNDSFTRGAELLAFVENVLLGTKAEKVNIIGHSQGALDARYVAWKIPDRVGAVV